MVGGRMVVRLACDACAGQPGGRPRVLVQHRRHPRDLRARRAGPHPSPLVVARSGLVCLAPDGHPGGRPATAIAAGSYSDHHQELFAIVDGEIWHRWWWRNDGWSAWHRQAPADMRATDIAVSSMKKDHLEVFAIDAGGRIRHRWYWAGRGWSDWQDFPLPGGSRVSALAAISGSARHQEIFGLTASGEIVHAWNWLADDGKPDWEASSNWSEWHSTPTSAKPHARRILRASQSRRSVRYRYMWNLTGGRGRTDRSGALHHVSPAYCEAAPPSLRGWTVEVSYSGRIRLTGAAYIVR